MGYKRRGPTERMIPDSKLHMYKIFKKKLLTWLYSFTRPGYVEDFEEYKISKKCLIAWMQDKTVLNLLGKDIVTQLLTWLKESVFIVEHYFLLLQTKASANILPGNHKSS